MMLSAEIAEKTVVGRALERRGRLVGMEVGARFAAGVGLVFLVVAVMVGVVVRMHRHHRGEGVSQQQHPPIREHVRTLGRRKSGRRIAK
jgi:hypothetical protein